MCLNKRWWYEYNFCQSAYVDTGGFNIISVDWSSFANDVNYPEPAILTASIGYAIAKFLDRLVKITSINASDIHLIGHSLGAHVLGICGSYFKNGKIGRITGEYVDWYFVNKLS